MRYILLDLEYSRDSQQKITEIGALKVEFNDMEKRPKITGIFNKKTKSIYKESLNSFVNWIGVKNDDYKLCCWDTEDKRILKKEYYREKIGIGWLKTHYTDLQDKYQKLIMKRYITIGEQFKELLGNRVKLSNQIGLKNALKAEKINFNGTPHCAFNDAYNMTKIFMRYFYEWNFVSFESKDKERKI